MIAIRRLDVIYQKLYFTYEEYFKPAYLRYRYVGDIRGGNTMENKIIYTATNIIWSEPDDNGKYSGHMEVQNMGNEEYKFETLIVFSNGGQKAHYFPYYNCSKFNRFTPQKCGLWIVKKIGDDIVSVSKKK